jgi:hypothetical protein
MHTRTTLAAAAATALAGIAAGYAAAQATRNHTNGTDTDPATLREQLEADAADIREQLAAERANYPKTRSEMTSSQEFELARKQGQARLRLGALRKQYLDSLNGTPNARDRFEIALRFSTEPYAPEMFED